MSDPTIHELMQRVREHPDFVFGTYFCTGDFPGEQVPEDFPVNRATDALAETGNLLIADICGEGEEI
jgi:hypothetical protein